MRQVQYFPEDSRYYLQNELTERSARRPSYSLRAFARDLELGVSTLSEYLNGKTGLSKKRVEHIAFKLKLAPPHREHFFDLVASKYGKSKAEKVSAKNRILKRLKTHPSSISNDEFKMIANWQHLALLEYIDLKKSQFNIKDAAKDLKISKAQVKESLQRLLNLKAIFQIDDSYFPTSDFTFTGDEAPSEAIKHFHKQLLRKAEVALYTQKQEDRNFRHVIFSMNQDDLPELKNELSRIHIELATKYDSRPGKNKIYCLGINLHKIF